MLTSKFERLSFAIAAIAFAVFGLRIYLWLQQPDHLFSRNTVSIPDYPFDGPFYRSRSQSSFIQNHRACTWTDVKPQDVNQSYDGPTMVTDELLSIDTACLFDATDKLIAFDSLIQLSTFDLLTRKYGNILLLEDMSKKESTLPKGNPSGEDIFIELATKALSKSGRSVSASRETVNRCLAKKPVWCLETNRLTNVHVWSIVKEDFYMVASLGVFILGFVCAFFSAAMHWFWKISFGKILAWIKDGK